MGFSPTPMQRHRDADNRRAADILHTGPTANFSLSSLLDLLARMNRARLSPFHISMRRGERMNSPSLAYQGRPSHCSRVNS